MNTSEIQIKIYTSEKEIQKHPECRHNTLMRHLTLPLIHSVIRLLSFHFYSWALPDQYYIIFSQIFVTNSPQMVINRLSELI